MDREEEEVSSEASFESQADIEEGMSQDELLSDEAQDEIAALEDEADM